MALFFDEEEAIKELQARGYRVVKEVYPEASSVRTFRDLVVYFYSRRRFYNPDRKFPFSIDHTEDVKYISSFVQSRQKLGLDRRTAVAEAASIIEGLFKFEKKLNMTAPIMSPAILTVRPLVDRVCSFINGELAEVNEYETELYVNEINEYYNKKFAQRDFESAAQARNLMLEKLDGTKRE